MVVGIGEEDGNSGFMHADCIFALLAEWDLMLVLYLYVVVLWTACTVMNLDACTLSPGGKIVVITCKLTWAWGISQFIQDHNYTE